MTYLDLELDVLDEPEVLTAVRAIGCILLCSGFVCLFAVISQHSFDLNDVCVCVCVYIYRITAC